MSVELVQVLQTVAVGFAATFVMDVWSIFLRFTFNVPLPNYCLLGRWFCYMREGVFRHSSISTTSQKPRECAVGWIAHYGTGAAFALLLILFTSARWLEAPTLLPAMIVGLVTVALPFFVVQPAYGLGIAASKTPNPMQAWFRSLANHIVFGFGLYLSAVAIRFCVAGFA